MATFEIETPDGRTFQVEGPDQQGALQALQQHLGSTSQPATSKAEMKGGQPQDRAAIMQALRNAHNAGDTGAARRLAAMAQQAGGVQSGGAPQAADGPWNRYQPQPETGPWQRYAAPQDEVSAAGPPQSVDLELARARAVARQRQMAATTPVTQGAPALAQPAPSPNAPMQTQGRGAIPPQIEPGTQPGLLNVAQGLRDNIMGDDDPTTMNGGERLAALLNKAGESLTVGIAGDEAAGAIDAMLGRGSAAERTQFYRDQEAQLDRENPVMSTAAAVGGGLLGPGKGVASLVNAGRSTVGRMLRGAGAGAAAGATYGAMEGEDAESRAYGAMEGGAIGGLAGGALVGLGQGFNAALQRLRGTPAARDVAPTLEGLRSQAQGLYRQAEEAGGVIPQDAVQSMATGTLNALRGAGYNARLHPRMSAVLDEMEELSAAGPASLQAMDQLRRIATNAAQSLQKDERRLGSLVVRRIDHAVSQMGGGSEMAAAREIWSRMQRMDTVESIIAKASNARNFETALQSGFRSLLNRNGGTRGFSAEEIRAMRQIASDGGAAGHLRTLGNLMSPDRFSGQLLTGGALVTGGGVGSLAIPAVGMTMRGAGNRLQRRQANSLRDSVGQNPIYRDVVEALRTQRNALAPAAGAGSAGAYEAVNALMQGSAVRRNNR